MMNKSINANKTSKLIVFFHFYAYFGTFHVHSSSAADLAPS